MGYWKIDKAHNSYAYRSKYIWWQFYRNANGGVFKYWSFGFSWYHRWKMFQISLGTWTMNFIFNFLQENDDDKSNT